MQKTKWTQVEGRVILYGKENCLHSEGSKELENVAQGGCSISTHEDIQHLTGHGPEMTQTASRYLFQPK